MNSNRTLILITVAILGLFTTYLFFEHRIEQERDLTDNTVHDLSEKILALESQLEDANGNIQELIEDNEKLKIIVDSLESKISSLESLVSSNEVPSDYTIINFLEFSEVDTTDDWVKIVSSNRIEHITSRTQSTYVYKEYSADFFSDFIFEFDFSADWADVYTAGYPFALTNEVNDIGSIIGSNNTGIGLQVYRRDSSPYYLIELCEVYEGNVTNVNFEQGLPNTQYYARVTKNDRSLSCELYSSNILRRTSDHGDIASLNLTLQANHSFKYLFGTSSHKTPYFTLNRNSIIITENMSFKRM